MNTNQLVTPKTSLGIDANELNALKRAAKEDQNSPQFRNAIKQTAQQFEGLLLNMLIKSMRQATIEGGLFDSESSKVFTSMQDQQLAQGLSARGMGLANMIAKQLEKAPKAPTATENQVSPVGGLPNSTPSVVSDI
jgi:flagellar protein FlgJ